MKANMRTREANLNQYSERIKSFPDSELLQLKSAVDYEVEIIRNLNGKKNNKSDDSKINRNVILLILL